MLNLKENNVWQIHHVTRVIRMILEGTTLCVKVKLDQAVHLLIIVAKHSITHARIGLIMINPRVLNVRIRKIAKAIMLKIT